MFHTRVKQSVPTMFHTPSPPLACPPPPPSPRVAARVQLPSPSQTCPDAGAVTSHREITGDLEGQGLRIGIVVARFNQAVTSSLLQGAQKALEEHGVRAQDVTIIRVPGSFELPVAAKRLAKRHTPDAIVCLGAIIHHETDHDRYLAQAVSQGLSALSTTPRGCTGHGTTPAAPSPTW